ncbi:hypothetical protein [Alteromonas sp. ASW11-130]|uniref:hypothetical protein n=1 Tax=Alteromonas sp. ASW11-130 TaxID=3015775 RepID=UPI002241CB7A|nr:hypothetical protein [Alteromonas sp. ASW11-130]MCW8091552.1 hypothetical protein [Alteromonas sp. ASW11-130]
MSSPGALFSNTPPRRRSATRMIGFCLVELPKTLGSAREHQPVAMADSSGRHHFIV